MLSKKLKVSKQIFQGAFKKSRTLSSDHLLLRFYKEDSIFPSKFSFTIPKSVSKKAVIRNLLKRRGYSIIRNLLVLSEVEEKKIKNSYICIFSFKKGADTLSFKQIKDEITLLLKKSQIKVD